MKISKRMVSLADTSVNMAKRLLPWAEKAANFWAAYWLLILGCLLIFGSAFLKWVQYPLSSNLSGLKLPLFHDSGVIPHVTLLSFGALGIVVLIAGVLLRRFFALALGLAAAVLITVSVLTPAHIAFQRPMMLRRLTDELQATPWHKVFTKEYLPANYGSPEVLPNRLVLYTASGRLLAAFSFLRLGWTCFALGSLLVGVYAIRRLPDGKMAIGLALVFLPVGALAIVMTPPIIGQHYFNSGSMAKARRPQSRGNRRLPKGNEVGYLARAGYWSLRNNWRSSEEEWYRK